MPETRFKPLPWTQLKRGVPCYLPRPAGHASVDANSPALEVMTDYRRLTPVTISRSASLDAVSYTHLDVYKRQGHDRDHRRRRSRPGGPDLLW